MLVARTTINVDRDALRSAGEALGTPGASATVNAALREAARRRALAEFDVRRDIDGRPDRGAPPAPRMKVDTPPPLLGATLIDTASGRGFGAVAGQTLRSGSTMKRQAGEFWSTRGALRTWLSVWLRSRASRCRVRYGGELVSYTRISLLPERTMASHPPTFLSRPPLLKPMSSW